jgi:hypothetical protein
MHICRKCWQNVTPEYVTENDNYYCPNCRSGCGNDYYRLAAVTAERDALIRTVEERPARDETGRSDAMSDEELECTAEDDVYWIVKAEPGTAMFNIAQKLGRDWLKLTARLAAAEAERDAARALLREAYEDVLDPDLEARIDAALAPPDGEAKP